MIKAEARFVHYFLAKYSLDPNVDNTPDELRSKWKVEKEAYIHGLVKEALHDLLPQFKKCTGIMPNMNDFPASRSTSMEGEGPGVDDSSSCQPSLIDAPVSFSSHLPVVMNISDYMGEKVNKLSSKRSTKVYFCTYLLYS